MSGLDKAWGEAEAALPEGWWFELYRAGHKEGDINPHTGVALGPQPGPYVATAQPAWYPIDDEGVVWRPETLADGDTPEAALRALVVQLRANR